MQRLIAVILMGFCLAVTACSTILEGAQESVLLTTPGAADSRCYIRNEYYFYIINPPRRFELERTSKPYSIVCIAPGNRVKTAIIPVSFEKASLYNVSNGVIPGVATDIASGAIFHYPDEIVIDFTGTKPSPMPLPAYQQMLDANPLIRGMEQFRPAIPALQSDESTQVIPLQKRDFSKDGALYGGSVLSPADVTGSDTIATPKGSFSSSNAPSASHVTPTVTGGPSTSFGTFKTPASNDNTSSGWFGNKSNTTPNNTTGNNTSSNATSSAPGNVTFVHTQTFTSTSPVSSSTSSTSP
jgi:hypothetical protein